MLLCGVGEPALRGVAEAGDVGARLGEPDGDRWPMPLPAPVTKATSPKVKRSTVFSEIEVPRGEARHRASPRAWLGGCHRTVSASGRPSSVSRRQLHDRDVVRLAAVEDPALPAAAEHHDAVRQAEHLLEIGADDDHRHARARKLGDDLVDRRARADVDAARRLVEDEDLGRRAPATWRSPPSAGCRRTACRRAAAGRPLTPSRLMLGSAKAAGRAFGQTQPFGATWSKLPSARFSAIDCSSTTALAPCGPPGRARCPPRWRRRGLRARSARPSTSTVPGRERIGAGDGAHQFGAAGPDDAGDAEDLAGSDREADVAKSCRRARSDPRRASTVVAPGSASGGNMRSTLRPTISSTTVRTGTSARS